MRNILNNGVVREDRTGTGTISVFGTQMRFDISNSIPLLTTKRVPFKTIVEELLWFCRGDTDAKILQKKGIGAENVGKRYLFPSRAREIAQLFGPRQKLCLYAPF